MVVKKDKKDNYFVSDPPKRGDPSINWKRFFCNYTDKTFSLKPEDDKKDFPHLKRIIIAGAKKGETLGMILNEYDIPNSRWKKFLKRNPKMLVVISDARQYHKAKGQEELIWYATRIGRDSPNPTIIKLLMANFYDIRDVPDNMQEIIDQIPYIVELTTEAIEPEEVGSVENGED